MQVKRFTEGGIVVDIDLEKIFDRINHDILMARLAKQIKDKRLLKITPRFLETGMMMHEVYTDIYLCYQNLEFRQGVRGYWQVQEKDGGDYP